MIGAIIDKKIFQKDNIILSESRDGAARIYIGHAPEHVIGEIRKIVYRAVEIFGKIAEFS
ncbi:hypothetical protein [uncultured Ruminococcus sp.]|uniref:hypothetical protein n=1 Tax=uncultured Ruminococcus sp. TaxID=165186 RepID=UPI0025EC3213|nr:hypothetical protein [uncultured Ruminococcus sp.]